LCIKLGLFAVKLRFIGKIVDYF